MVILLWARQGCSHSEGHGLLEMKLQKLQITVIKAIVELVCFLFFFFHKTEYKYWYKLKDQLQGDDNPTDTQKYQRDGTKMSSPAGKAGLPSMMNRPRWVSVNYSMLSVDFSNHFECENCNYFELIRDTFWFFKYAATGVEVGNTWIKHNHSAATSGQKTVVSGPEPTPWWRTRLKKKRNRWALASPSLKEFFLLYIERSCVFWSVLCKHNKQKSCPRVSARGCKTANWQVFAQAGRRGCTQLRSSTWLGCIFIKAGGMRQTLKEGCYKLWTREPASFIISGSFHSFFLPPWVQKYLMMYRPPDGCWF